jgi:hypothetical protein
MNKRPVVSKPIYQELEKPPQNFCDYMNSVNSRFSEVCKIYLDGMSIDDIKFMLPEDLINLVPQNQYKHRLLMTIMVRRYLYVDDDSQSDVSTSHSHHHHNHHNNDNHHNHNHHNHHNHHNNDNHHNHTVKNDKKNKYVNDDSLYSVMSDDTNKSIKSNGSHNSRKSNHSNHTNRSNMTSNTSHSRKNNSSVLDTVTESECMCDDCMKEKLYF